METTGLTFSEMCTSLTVFNLIQANMIPKLFDLFSLALRCGSPPAMVLRSPSSSHPRPNLHKNDVHKKESANSCSATAHDDTLSGCKDGANVTLNNSFDSESQDTNRTMHCSMTLPCIIFQSAKTPFNITITLMNDIDPAKRCFHCILSPVLHLSTRASRESKTLKYPIDESLGKIKHISSTSLARLL